MKVFAVMSRSFAVAVFLLAGLLVGCASSSGSSMLDLFGSKKPELPAVELPPMDRKVALRVHAGDTLNTDAEARSLSVVVKIYKLKDAAAFLSAPLTAFKDAASEKEAFGSDLVEAREVVLTPGQKYEVTETLPLTIGYVGVVAHFRAPADGRWRFAFTTKGAEKSGITLGVHGCAMSVAAGDPVNTAPELLRLAGVRCH